MEIRNVSAKCIDMNNPSAMVLHKVDYEYKDSGVWVGKTVQVMATDPMDAIKYVRGGYGEA